MKILVLNCGSSSIKFNFYDMTQNKILLEGIVEKVGMRGSFLKIEKESGEKVRFEGEILDHKIGVEYILGVMTSKKHGCIENLEEINAVGHRLVHGGDFFNASTLLTEDVIQKVTDCIELAPLHNPANLQGIRAMQALLPEVLQVGVFDTAFHQTMPPKAFMYGIPYSLYKKYKIRRYGFHGTSHRYVYQKACELLGVDSLKQKIITCHLGNGASITAIEYGKSVDTSMGFTPLEGLIMGTRTGDLDVGAVTYIMDKEEIGRPALSTLLNKFSGMLGITGISSDMREIEAKAKEGNERAILGLDMYAHKVKKYIGSYLAILGGADIIVFTGGIGENDIDTRERICKGLEFAGVELDLEKNSKRGETIISTEKSKVKIMVVETDEEFVIAKDTMEIISGLN